MVAAQTLIDELERINVSLAKNESTRAHCTDIVDAYETNVARWHAVPCDRQNLRMIE